MITANTSQHMKITKKKKNESEQNYGGLKIEEPQHK